jgi:hypothetical protein
MSKEEARKFVYGRIAGSPGAYGDRLDGSPLRPIAGRLGLPGSRSGSPLLQEATTSPARMSPASLTTQEAIEETDACHTPSPNPGTPTRFDPNFEDFTAGIVAEFVDVSGGEQRSSPTTDFVPSDDDEETASTFSEDLLSSSSSISSSTSTGVNVLHAPTMSPAATSSHPLRRRSRSVDEGTEYLIGYMAFRGIVHVPSFSSRFRH